MIAQKIAFRSLILAVTLALAIPGCYEGQNTKLLDAAEKGDLQTVRKLVEGGANVNQAFQQKFGWTPLMGAIFHDRKDVVFYLVEHGATVNAADKRGITPLMYAIGFGDKGVPLVEYLLDHGASLDAKDNHGATVFSYAHSQPPKPKLIELLEARKK